MVKIKKYNKEDYMENIEEIKSMYKDIGRGKKNDFKKKVAIKFELTQLSIHNHWFGGAWAIPNDQKKITKVKSMLKKEINEKS